MAVLVPQNDRDYLPAIKRFMYGILAIVLLLSLLSISLRTSLVREAWFSLSPLDEEPSANPWIYSIVAGIEVLHMCFLFFAFSAVYDSSPSRSLATSVISILVAIVFMVSIAFVGCYGLIFGSIAVFLSLGALFAAFGQFVTYEDIPFEFLIRTRDGKTSPLI